MREKTKNAIIKIQQLTESKCRTCETDNQYRCCDNRFCMAVERGLEDARIKIEKTGNKEIPFMGKDGCVVPPELRPGCSGYVCQVHFKDRKFRREYEKLHKKFINDPFVGKLMLIANAYLSKFFNK